MYRLVHSDNFQTVEEYQEELKEIFGENWQEYADNKDAYNFPFDNLEDADKFAEEVFKNNKYMEKVYLVKVIGYYEKPVVTDYEFKEVQ